MKSPRARVLLRRTRTVTGGAEYINPGTRPAVSVVIAQELADTLGNPHEATITIHPGNRHTALGDGRWARDVYDHVTGMS